MVTQEPGRNLENLPRPEAYAGRLPSQPSQAKAGIQACTFRSRYTREVSFPVKLGDEVA